MAVIESLRRCLCRLLLLIVTLSLMAAQTAVAAPRVLALISYDPTWASLTPYTIWFRDILDKKADIHYVFMNSKVLPPQEAREYAMSQFPALTSDGRLPYDIVYSCDDDALDFVLDNRNTLFRDIPVVFNGINDIDKALNAAANSQMTGVVELYPLRDTIQLALSLTPNAERIIAIVDNTSTGRGFVRTLTKMKGEFTNVEITFLNTSELTQREIANYCHQLKPTDVPIFMVMTHDKDGNNYSPDDAGSFLARELKVPLYRVSDYGLGRGFIGGFELEAEASGRMAGGMIAWVLAGENISQMPVEYAPTRAIFDEQVINEFGLSKKNLPENTIYINHVPTFIDRYRDLLIPGSVVGLLMIILAAYSYHRSRQAGQRLAQAEEEKRILERLQQEHNVLQTVTINLTRKKIISQSIQVTLPGMNITFTNVETPFKAWGALIVDDDARRKFNRIFSFMNLRDEYRVGNRSVDFEAEYKDSHGSSRWMHAQANLLRETTGGELLMIFYVRDIDDYKRDQLAVRSAMEGEIDYIACLDLHTGLAHMIEQSTFVRTLASDFSTNYVYETEWRKAIDIIIGAEKQSEYQMTFSTDSLKNRLSRGQEVRFLFWTDSGGRHAYKQLRASFLDERRDKIVFVQKDITEVYEDEARRNRLLERALAAAQQASRAKSDFLSRVSHEIRTPLNAIIGLTGLTRSRTTDAEYVATSLAKIDTSAEFLLSLINDVLDISRIERGKMLLDKQPHRLDVFLAAISDLVRPKADEKGVVFTFQDQGELPEACVFDSMKLKQVLINIISNAIKFTPKDGSVTASIECVELKEDSATLRFTVADTGIGIAKEFIPRLFHAFEQESAGNTTIYGGTGLGMAISKNIIDLMGGTIEVASEKGHGATFTVTVTLPLSEPPASEKPIGSDSENLDFSGHRVLLVEDNEINREIAEMILQEVGLTVETATNGEEAVDMFLSHEGSYYGLIFMDVRMPVMDGLEATRRIRASDSSAAQTIPIVAMSANAMSEDVAAGHAAGMNE